MSKLDADIYDVRFAAGGTDPKSFNGVLTFSITQDMLELADPFSMSTPFHIELWNKFATDSEVEIYFDDTRVLTGFIDNRKRRLSKSGSMIEISGRDRGGRLIDESAPLKTFNRLGIVELANEMVGDWFDYVSLSNAENRRVLGGRKRSLAGVSKEPAILTGPNVAKKVEPGESRAQVLQSVLEEAGLLAWSSADGKTFIVGKPNYDQEAQFRFFAAGPNSPRAAETNVREMNYSEDATDVYSEYQVMGSGRGNSANYGKNVLRRRGSAFDANGPKGTGLLFSHPKRLIIADGDIRSAKQAKQRAEEERDLRLTSAYEFEVTVAGWGQKYKDNEPVLYSCDKVAIYEDEEAEIYQECLITRVQFNESKTGGQLTTLSMVPVGTELSFS